MSNKAFNFEFQLFYTRNVGTVSACHRVSNRNTIQFSHQPSKLPIFLEINLQSKKMEDSMQNRF